jgi:N-acetylmuramoyl-L-alanine amidase
MYVALSTGHSRKDCGAISPLDGTKEYDVNCAIVSLMERQGLCNGEYEMIDALYEDEPYPDHLVNTVDAINDRHTDFACCLEIHHNASVKPKVHGAQVIYWDDSVDGKRLAQSIVRYLCEVREIAYHPFKKYWRETQKEYYQPGALSTLRHVKRRLYYLAKTKIPAVIVEVGYLTNEYDLHFIKHNQLLSAGAINNGVDEYLGLQ